jgi:hypothetical protein
LNEVDPDGITMRKRGKLKRRVMWSAGPDHTWSFDGQDKLMPYGNFWLMIGLAVHGCVDVASGYLVWLRVDVTNHDPNLIAFYFLQAVKERNRNLLLMTEIPYSTRSDCGTETVKLVSENYALHDLYETNVPVKEQHRYVKLVHNKIESCWSRYRCHIPCNFDFLYQSIIYLVDYCGVITYLCFTQISMVRNQ